MSKKLTTEEFVKKAQIVHGNRYDYSKINYIKSCMKVCIICLEHGKFWQRPNDHLSKKRGCPICGGTGKLNTIKFIKKARKIHGNKYDYSKIEYVNSKTKVTIVCPEHGEFQQTPNNHLSQKQSCSACSNKRKHTTESFIQKANKVHNNKYNYSKVKYINGKTKVCIICLEHGEFWQISRDHLRGIGCVYCGESKGENLINKFLIENDIKFERQKKFKNCRNRRLLPFDFYLIEHNLLIEYDGKQHFTAIDFFGGKKGFSETKINDEIKNNFVKESNVDLLRISYKEFDKVKNILVENIVI